MTDEHQRWLQRYNPPQLIAFHVSFWAPGPRAFGFHVSSTGKCQRPKRFNGWNHGVRISTIPWNNLWMVRSRFFSPDVLKNPRFVGFCVGDSEKWMVRHFFLVPLNHGSPFKYTIGGMLSSAQWYHDRCNPKIISCVYQN